MEGEATRAARRTALSVAALGIVFGDIGTSPIYTIQTAFDPSDPHPIQASLDSVYGIVSLIFWSVTLIVTVKYVGLVMKADNQGEGGIMALISQIRQLGKVIPARRKFLLAGLGVFGAALFFGDSMITPAISVLSAVEGTETISSSMEPLVIPITLVIIVALFMVQRHGTGPLGRLFGPIMLVWFATIAVLGIRGITMHPEVLEALSPTYAIDFLFGSGSTGFFALASVVLAITGAEALYADMGHFGRPAIARAWLLLVFPACILSYLGQGALILDDPGAISAPFFQLMPHAGLVPLVLLATAATVIASQAVISGAFSLAHQASELGYLPRLRVIHTSERQLRTDLRAGDQHAPAGRGRGAGRDLPELRQARLHLRDGGHRHDRDHDGPVLRHRASRLAAAALARARRRGGLPHPGARHLGGEPHQAHPRGLGPARHRADPVRGHDDLVPRAPDGRGASDSRSRARCRRSSTASESSIRPCRDHPGPACS